MSGVASVLFNGTLQDAARISTALTRNCACSKNSVTGAIVDYCAGHNALMKDQRFLDGILFARYGRPRWFAGEFIVDRSDVPDEPDEDAA